MKYGIICQDDIAVVGHSLFNNFKLALINYFKVDFKCIQCIEDLNDINILLIVDEHYIPHKGVWMNDIFIEYVNKNNIVVVIFNFEKIYNSQFPWNLEIQNYVEKINKKIQLVSDVQDATILNSSIINKQILSKDTYLATPIEKKQDEIVFIGQINEYYPTRNNVLNELQQKCSKFKIIKTDRKYSYEEFLDILNNSKYILNPLGTGMFINLRFYEALKLKCIILQQYTDEMVPWYKEIIHPHVILFRTVEELILKLTDVNFKSDFNLTLEGYFTEINLKAMIDNL